MFKIRIVVQQGNKFDAMLFKDKESVGGVGKDDEGFYINLSRRLTIQESIDLLKMINGLNEEFYRSEVAIRYVD
ncbi:hypothetical protein [Niallia sp. RD1]|uniref:hypothetical protein n=1 Tax=Niallia sp. RD1 TaxID=2962858 RepID=UPI0020C1A759|nr:hypothetical protein [Niallia sp. RD1]UTI44403.1 hypothetical protein NKG37_12735 [Niallia sp. RD1]